MEPLFEELKRFAQEYHRRLPIRLTTRYPYCGEKILQYVDFFSLIGYFSPCPNSELYRGSLWYYKVPFRKVCDHAVIMTYAVNLQGLVPDDIVKQGIRLQSEELDSAPLVIVWPLVARQTSVVMHAVPIGRLDDPEPVHRYTAYFMTYFASDKSNLRTDKMYVHTDVGYAATEGVKTDRDLAKWIRAGRLFWLDPDDPEHPLVHGAPENFPYGNIRPEGWYRILNDGKVDGLHPYNRSLIWNGSAPSHDQSFSKSVED
ncbi:MAG: hypothetical protein R2941_09725 [Desulfobacterales bacterium]